MTSNLKHDALIKKILTNPVAAQEFLEYYLPADFKAIVDLTKITIEKESFVEEDLRRKLSDLVFSVQTKNHDTAFVYVLIEAQATADHWIALRLWKYILLLCERHKQKKDGLPLICPLLIYHGAKTYNAPRNLWQLFSHPEHAKKLMTEDYQLIDLQSMPEDEILKKKQLGMFEYMLKYIHKRDLLKVWAELLSKCPYAVLIDKEKNYLCIKTLLWYTDAKLPEAQQQELERIISSHLSKEETVTIMRTIAQKYIDEGMQQGIIQGMEKGIEKGMEKGMEKGIEKGMEKEKAEIAQKMLANNMDHTLIAHITGLDVAFIRTLKQRL
ncbi:Rpn family recombination-promoting nuclease/putative transposase [Candidatus Cardinium hertigii]|uniref:Rpn family recombination-promoting nuclease/putative transposase n=1 Tax=Candidatus Cardinium hertigii TaxID=247481 RepID=A0A3N2QC44_9BACT|nr:Rpn family recombination-promoting nuclease/putative transposase [Candidatus Cardinium hertigii]ROT47355.1 Rpn family recombination-promoting nuclease/putative transposase [Candidatus Cardinium hertigii]